MYSICLLLEYLKGSVSLQWNNEITFQRLYYTGRPDGRHNRKYSSVYHFGISFFTGHK